MKRIAFAALLALTGCQHDQSREDFLQEIGQQADYAMDRATAWICSGRMSLRAYTAYLERHRLSIDQLADFCGWPLDDVRRELLRTQQHDHAD